MAGSDSMRRKHFTFEFPADAVAGSRGVKQLNLPVDVHDRRTFKLVGSGTLQGGVKLTPGRSYCVTATLPDGSRISTHAKADPRLKRIQLLEPKSVWRAKPRAKIEAAEAKPAPTEAAEAKPTPTPVVEGFPTKPFDWSDPKALDFGKAASVAEKSEPFAKIHGHPVRIAAFHGNLLKGKETYFSLSRADAARAEDPSLSLRSVEEVVDGAWFVPSHGGTPTYVQLFQSGFPVKNYAVPIASGDRCTVRLLRADRELHMDITLANPDANLLLRYVGSNMLYEVAQIAESPAILAQNLLAGKFEFPIGAAIGGYVLLRLGELDRLHDWTRNLYKIFPWLPDGAVIFAEHQARIGQHNEALKALLELPKRGLPFASSGLTYALNRARQYQLAIEQKLLKGDLATVKALVEVLGRYAKFVDMARPILTFTGNNPLRPGRDPAVRFHGASKAVNISLTSSEIEGARKEAGPRTSQIRQNSM
jgi:hypothetical protein